MNDGLYFERLSRPPISARPVLQHASGGFEHCRDRSCLRARRELTRVLVSRPAVVAGPARAEAGHLRLSLGRIRPRGSPARVAGRLAQAREVQNHEGSVDQDRRRYSHHGEPGRARQAPRSLVVIGGTHEAPVSHP